MENKKRRQGHHFSWFALALLVVVAYFGSVLVSQQMHLNQVAKDYEAVQSRLQAAQQEHERLQRERDDLTSHEYIEKIAREELGMTKQGELPYITGKK